MADIITFRPKRLPPEPRPVTFTKVVDGEAFECVDVDALTTSQREAFFEGRLFEPRAPEK